MSVDQSVYFIHAMHGHYEDEIFTYGPFISLESAELVASSFVKAHGKGFATIYEGFHTRTYDTSVLAHIAKQEKEESCQE